MAEAKISDGLRTLWFGAGFSKCNRHFTQVISPMVANVPWIHGKSWDPSQKIVVHGKVRWPQARITITRRGRTRVIHTRDLPVGATTGTFPILPSTAAYRYDRNPNKIAPQDDIIELGAVA